MGGGLGKESLQSLVSVSGYHCVMIGLDNSGKTTILYRIKYGQYTNTTHTIGFNCEKVKTRSGKVFTIWDVGGQEKTRPLWRSYTRCTDAIIFVVDSCDSDRMEEAKMELLKIAKLTERHSVPIMVLANKQDLPLAQDMAKLEKVMGLKDLGRNVGWCVRPCCAVTGEGLEEAFGSLQELIIKKKHTGSKPVYSKGRQCKKVQRSHSHHF